MLNEGPTIAKASAKKKTKSEATASLLAQRQQETARGRAALAALESERTAAASSYADDMTDAARVKVSDLDDRIREAKTTLEALAVREARAERDHAAAVDAERRAELAELQKAIDVDALERELVALLVAPALAFDREQAARIDRARSRLREHREIVVRAQALGVAVGVAVEPRPISIDDVSVVAGVAIAKQHDAGGAPGAEHFIAPIHAAFVREGTVLVPNPHCSPEQFEHATAYLAKEGIEK